MNTKFKFIMILSLSAALLFLASCSEEGGRTRETEDSASSQTVSSSQLSEETATYEGEIHNTDVDSQNDSSAYVTHNQSSLKSDSTEESTTKKISAIRAFFNKIFGKDEEEVSTTAAPPRSDYSAFDNTAFIGNSRVDTFKDYGLLPNAKYFTKVGLNIRNVYDDDVLNGQTALQGLKNNSFDTIILVFGDNECAWPYTDVFINEYSDFIDKVAELQPNAHIYLQSVLPISESASNKNQDDMNMDLINAINIKIKKLAADKGVGFFDTPTGLTDGNGYLNADAASDGIHFGKKYCLLWIDYMNRYLGD